MKHTDTHNDRKKQSQKSKKLMPGEEEGEELDKTSALDEDKGHDFGGHMVEEWDQSTAEPGISRSPLPYS